MRAVRVVLRILGAVALAAIQAAWLAYPQPWTAKAAALVLLGLTLARPSLGLVALAACAPMSSMLAGLTGTPLAGAKFLEQLVLAVVIGSVVRGTAASGGTRIGAPGAIFGAIGLASALSVMPALAAIEMPGDGALAISAALWRQAYFIRSPFSDPVYFAVLAVECAALAWVIERAVRAAPELGGRLVAALLAGAAVSAVHAVWVVVTSAMARGHSVGDVVHLLATARKSLQTDTNAAASILVLILLAGFGRLAPFRWGRAWQVAALFAVAEGLWLAGSRIALGALVLGLAIAGIVALVRLSSRARLRVAAALACGMAVTAALIVFYPAERNWNLRSSIESRAILTKAGVTMFRGAPAFGVGIGRFYEESRDAAGGEIGRVLGGDNRKENAHNNFVQVLAEEGLTGLTALLLVVGVGLGSALWAERAAPAPLRLWLALGIGASVVTWLTGHPLLVPEFAFVFWLALGTLTGLTPAPTPLRFSWLPPILVVGVFATVPARALDRLGRTDLEHIGAGLSPWQHDEATAYRRAGTAFAVFLPAADARVVVPFRRASGAPDPMVLEIKIGGRLVNQVTVAGAGWQSVELIMSKGDRRFVLTEFHVMNAPDPAADHLVDIGKAVIK